MFLAKIKASEIVEEVTGSIEKWINNIKQNVVIVGEYYNINCTGICDEIDFALYIIW